MKNIQWLLVALFLCFISTGVFADTILLRNGTKIEGFVTKQTATHVTIVSGNREREVRKAYIRTIKYEAATYRVIVRMTTGKEFFANLINEDNTKYTFRKFTKATRTFSIIKRNISFLVPASPANLKAASGPTTITLKWNHPYKEPKYYNIYLKKGDGSFKLSGQTSKNEFELEGLASITGYSVKVTAVDLEDEESQPAVIDKVMTKNMAPNAPFNLKSKTTLSKDKTKMKLLLTWDEPIDPDGTVQEYRVYKRHGSSYDLVGKTRTTRFMITNLDPNESRDYAVRAVDNMDKESGDGTVSSSYLPKSYFLSLQYNFILPTASYADVSQSGSGIVINYTIFNTFTENMLFQVSAGFYNFNPLDSDVGSLYSVPLSISFGYMFHVSERLSISPYLGGGLIMHYVKEKDENDIFQTKNYFAAQSRINIEFNYKYTENVFLLFNTGYTLFFEKDDTGQYAVFGVGVQFLL